MPHAEFTVTVVDLAEGSHGELAAQFIVDSENEKRAAFEPPIDPLPVAPFAALVDSYLIVLSATITRAHGNYIVQQAAQQSAIDKLDQRWLEGGSADRAASLAQLPPAPEV
jgi:hypothetical protein